MFRQSHSQKYFCRQEKDSDMKKVIAFGDSVLKGVIIDKDRSASTNVRYMYLDDNFTSQCGKRLGMDITNYGKFGSTIETGQKILERHIAAVSKSDYTFLEYGGNDSDHNWEEIAESPGAIHKPRTDLMTFSLKYKEIIDEVRRFGSTPLMLSLTPLDSERYFNHFTRCMDAGQKSAVRSWLGGSLDTISSWHEMYNLQVFKLAIAMKVPVIDITTAFLAKKDYRDYLCEDGIHPNEDGHRLIADAICDHLTTVKPERRRLLFSI